MIHVSVFINQYLFGINVSLFFSQTLQVHIQDALKCPVLNYCQNTSNATTKDELIQLNWYDMVNNINGVSGIMKQNRYDISSYINQKLEKLEPLKRGMILDNTKWVTLKSVNYYFYQHKLFLPYSDILVYNGQTELEEYLIYKRIYNYQSHILIAHKSAKISILFSWEDKVILMDGVYIHYNVTIGKKNIIGPGCSIQSNTKICHNNIFLENVQINNFTKIMKNNIFLGNNKIGSDIGLIASNFYDKLRSLKNKMVKNLQINYFLIAYFEKNYKKTEIGSFNIFHPGVIIGNFSRIHHFNIFESLAHICDFVMIGSGTILGTSSYIHLDCRVEKMSIIYKFCKILEHTYLPQRTVVKPANPMAYIIYINQ